MLYHCTDSLLTTPYSHQLGEKTHSYQVLLPLAPGHYVQFGSTVMTGLAAGKRGNKGKERKVDDHWQLEAVRLILSTNVRDRQYRAR